MRARHWMIGCLIGLAGMGSALAADVGDHDITVPSRTAVESSHAADGNGGGVLGLNRDNSSPHHDNDAGIGDADTHDTDSHGRTGSTVPATTQPTTLGWQSLLPGSIQ